MESNGHGLKEVDFLFMKYFICINRIGRKVFLFMFKYLYEGGAEPVDQYLSKRFSNTEIKKTFGSMQKKFVKERPVNEFDVTLLYLLLQLICGLPKPDDQSWTTPLSEPKLPNLLYLLKSHRNECAHEYFKKKSSDYKQKLLEVKSIISEIFNNLKSETNIDEFEIKSFRSSIEEEINKIEISPLPPECIYDHLIEIRKEKIDILKNQGREELKSKYSTITQVPLAPWPVGDVFMNVHDMFINTNLSHSKTHILQNQSSISEESVNIENILQMKRSDGSAPGFILISGTTGIGKTTLLKYILHDWISENCNIKEMKDFDLVLFMDCREFKVDSPETWFQTLMPKTTSLLPVNEMSQLILSMNCLMIMDNINELSKCSLNIFEEIISSKMDSIKVIAASHSNLSDEIMKHAHKKKTIRFEINGVPTQKLVKNLTNILNTGKDSNKFLNIYLPRQLCNQPKKIQSPEILTQLFFHWVTNPEQKNADISLTHLYLKSQNILIEKLVDAIKKEDPRKEKQNLRESITEFLKCLGHISFNANQRNSVFISSQEKNIIMHKCNMLSLPQSILSEFLCFQNGDNILLKTNVNAHFPSKSMQEFYAAYHVYSKIVSQSTKIDLIRLLLLGDPIENISRIKQMLVFLIGLLNISSVDYLENYSKEIARLIRKTGVELCKDWLPYVEEAKTCELFVNDVREQIDDDWSFEDYSISGGILELIKIKPPTNLVLTASIADVNLSHLNSLLRYCSCLPKLDLTLHLYNHFWLNRDQLSDEYIQYLNCPHVRCSLKSFAGRLSPLEILNLPDSLKRLALQVLPKDIESINKVIKKMTLLELLYLNINIKPNTPITSITKLNLKGVSLSVDLWRVKSDELDWTADFVGKLSPGYSRLVLRKTTLTSEDAKNWISKLISKQLCVFSLVIGSTETLSLESEKECVVLSKELKCTEFKWIKI